MKVALLSRYPRVDTGAWKRQLAQGLLDEGVDLILVYSRAGVADHVRAGISEFGFGVLSRYAAARRGAEGVAAEPATSLAAWAAERGVAVALHRRLDDVDCLSFLRDAAPDVAVLAGADIIPRAVLEIPRIGTLNPHYGLLPRYRGMNVTEWSIYHDDPVGVSVHWVDAGIDTGAIAVREPIAVQRGETLGDLRAKHRSAAARLMLEAVRQALAGSARAMPQDPADGRQYYRMHPELRRIVERRLERGEYRWLGADRSALETALRAQPWWSRATSGSGAAPAR